MPDASVIDTNVLWVAVLGERSQEALSVITKYIDSRAPRVG
jgi:hypothetical protein